MQTLVERACTCRRCRYVDFSQNSLADNLKSLRIMRKSLLTAVFAGIFSAACAAETTTPLTLPSADKKTAITLQLAAGWKTFPNKDGSVSIDIPNRNVHIEVRALGQASVEEAAKQVTDLVKSQVTHFKVTESKPVLVAGAAGQQLTGTGEEADDGDPSNADVYLFSVEGKVFMLCAHGEGDGSVKNRPLVTTLLASVKKAG